MKSYYRLAFLLLLPLMSMGPNSCERDIAPKFTLPPTTQEGANTLGFNVNGRAWQCFGVRCTAFGCDTNKVRADYQSKSSNLDLTAGQTARGVDELFGLVVDSVQSGTTYATTPPIPTGGTYRAVRTLLFTDRATGGETYRALPDGRITITRLDTAQHIVAGTFAGTLQGMNTPSKSLSITDGRFDMHYEAR